MATIKKACKGVSYPKSSSVSKRLGSPSRAKNGKSFPDLNKDGKITKADILKGRGVIAKKGMKVRKAQDGLSTNSKTEKPELMDRIFGTAESRAANKVKRQERRADNKINRENNRLENQAYRQSNRAERQSRRACKGGSCGGRALGFSGYNKNGGKTSKKK